MHERRREPVLGWRVWHVDGGWLESWAAAYRWVPGENVATCLGPQDHRCRTPPGEGCGCGFWALWTPLHCAYLASSPLKPFGHVMGLVAGWGTVAIHAREGFRAERAALRCLVTDRPWIDSATRACLPRLPSERPLGAGRGGPDARLALEAVAARYAVPLVSLRQAADLGLLGELGLPRERVEAAARLGRRLPPGSSRP